MEPPYKKIAAVMLALLAILGSPEKAESICKVSTDDLMKCQPAATPPDPPPPTAECCATLARADLVCLCNYKSNPLLPLIGIDPKLALDLPAKCNLPNHECF